MTFNLSFKLMRPIPLQSALRLGLRLGGLSLLLSAFSFSAHAQRGPRPDTAQGGPPGGPPAEAFAACKALSSDATCTVDTPHGKLSGTCTASPRHSELVCAPKGHRRRGSKNSQRPTRSDSGLERFGHERFGHERFEPEAFAPRERHDFRQHTITKSAGLETLNPATQRPIAPNIYKSEIKGEWRILTANSIAAHNTGVFPNDDNPNTISEQSLTIRVPANPALNSTASPVKVLGYALNGVEFDPGAGEFYKGAPSKGWQYEALSGAVALGIDENHAHVQPQGKYHYHGLPTLFLKDQNLSPEKHSPQIGWAVDGFPIYALYGFENGNSGDNAIELQSSYTLKSGHRPSGDGHPGGVYDGTFTADYEYVSGHGDLDACNGRMTVTPEFLNGTYAYFLTESFPVVPRCVMGTPSRYRR